jgi:antitoxin Phd
MRSCRIHPPSSPNEFGTAIANQYLDGALQLTITLEHRYSDQNFWPWERQMSVKRKPRVNGLRAAHEPTWSLQDAKNRFSAVVNAAAAQPQTVTKHGKPAVVIVAVGEFERLRRLEKLTMPSFTEMLLAIPKGDVTFDRMKAPLREVEF